MKNIKRREQVSEERIKRNLGVANTKAIQNYFNTRQHTFTKSMKNIANAILKHPDILKNNMLVNFSKTLDLGEASVMRFCKHLGFRGFTEFKRYFIDEFFDIPVDLNKGSQLYDLDITSEATPIEILNKIGNLVNHVTETTKRDLTEAHDDLVEVVEKIYYAPRLFIYGTSASKSIIEETASRFINIGVTVIYATELQDMINKSCLMQKCDVGIAVCTSGYSNDLVKVTSLLNKNRVHTIAITSDPRSELAINSNTTFNCFSGDEKELNPYQDSIYTRLSQMIIFDTILAMVIGYDIVRAREHRVTAFSTLEQVLVSRNDSPTII